MRLFGRRRSKLNSASTTVAVSSKKLFENVGTDLSVDDQFDIVLTQPSNGVEKSETWLSMLGLDEERAAPSVDVSDVTIDDVLSDKTSAGCGYLFCAEDEPPQARDEEQAEIPANLSRIEQVRMFSKSGDEQYIPPVRTATNDGIPESIQNAAPSSVWRCWDPCGSLLDTTTETHEVQERAVSPLEAYPLTSSGRSAVSPVPSPVSVSPKRSYSNVMVDSDSYEQHKPRRRWRRSWKRALSWRRSKRSGMSVAAEEDRESSLVLYPPSNRLLDIRTLPPKYYI